MYSCDYTNTEVILNNKTFVLKKILLLKDWTKEIPTKVLKHLQKFEEKITYGKFPLKNLKREYFVSDIANKQETADPWLLMQIEGTVELTFLLSAWDDIKEY